MKQKFELHECDAVLGKLLGKVGEKVTLEEARIEAKKLAEGWCVDEKPKKVPYGGYELWIGEADFGIVIIPKGE